MCFTSLVCARSGAQQTNRSHASPRPNTPLVEGIESRVMLSVSVTTYHNGTLRLGQNTLETQLNANTVKKGSFALRHTVNVDGSVYAQPLYLSGISVPNQGTHNVVYVATEHDSLYAIDASSGLILWRHNFLQTGEQTVTPSDVSSSDISPEIGITGTPVIDTASNTIYLVTKAKKTVNGTTTFIQRLQAVDTRSGVVKAATVIQASVAGTGAGHVGSTVSFNSLRQQNRAGLLLMNGVVYAAFGSHSDRDPYHGWLLGYSSSTLQQVSVFNTTRNGTRGAIWQGGAAPAAFKGNIFAGVGNGTFDANTGGSDYGDSLIKLSTTNNQLKVADSFTTFDQATEGQQLDRDVGSGGTILIPQNGLAIVGDKQGKLYVCNMNNLGGFNSTKNNIIQTIKVTPSIVYATPAYLNGSIYLAGVGDTLKQFKIGSDGHLTLASQSAATFGFPGSTPSISSNGSSNGIVWAIERQGSSNAAVAGQMVLHAYDANNLSHQLWVSTNDGVSDGGNNTAVKFSVPTIADGRVFVGTNGALKIFGLS